MNLLDGRLVITTPYLHGVNPLETTSKECIPEYPSPQQLDQINNLTSPISLENRQNQACIPSSQRERIVCRGWHCFVAFCTGQPSVFGRPRAIIVPVG